MDNKETVDGVESTKIDYSTMSTEELIAFAEKANKKANDQELARKKREEEIKELKAEKSLDSEGQDVVPTTPAPVTQKEDLKESGVSLAEVRLANTLSNDEIEQAKKYAQAFGMSLEEASNDDGFKARIESTRKISKSEDMSIDDIGTLSVRMSDDEFMKAMKAGNIDMNSQESRDRAVKLARQEYKSIKA